MLKERAQLVAGVLFTLDLAAVSAAFLSAYWLRDTIVPWLGWRTELYPLDRYLPFLPLILAIWAVLLWSSNAYRSHRSVSLIDEAWTILRVNAAGLVILVLMLYTLRLDERVLGNDHLSRLWILFFLVLTGPLTLAPRVLVRLLARYVRSRGYNYRNVVIVGTGEAARSIRRSLTEHRYWGYKVVGFATPEVAAPGQKIDGIPVVGSAAELPQLALEQVIDEVFVAVEQDELKQLEKSLQGVRELGICLRLALDPFPFGERAGELSDLEGTPLLTFPSGPAQPALLFLKRSFDLAVSLVLLVIAIPIMAAIAAAIKVTSKGDVLFRQTRCGLNGRPFTLYKFRTMVANAENQLEQVEGLNEMNGPVFKARNDPRVTPLGRLLRRHSLDELPQLWNVVAGSMSLVGPRPPIPEEVARYKPWQRRRLSVRPGLTCLWQISGRNDLDFDRWIELDLHYIDSWSPVLDLKILLKTIPAVLSGRGAS